MRDAGIIVLAAAGVPRLLVPLILPRIRGQNLGRLATQGVARRELFAALESFVSLHPGP